MASTARSVRWRPGEIRDAIVGYLRTKGREAAISEIQRGASEELGSCVPGSSVRSYLRLNTPDLFSRVSEGTYSLRDHAPHGASVPVVPLASPAFVWRKTLLFQGDCLAWLGDQPRSSIHAVVTDPPYGLLEYSALEQKKLRRGRGGVWRIPPSFDGHKRAPLPRFTVLDREQIDQLRVFFRRWADALRPVLVPGANVIVASNPLLSYIVANELANAGLERRGEIIRLVMTMRGGDRPKNAHTEFPGVSVMPRSMWEPWLLFRNPLEGRVQDNLRKWKTGGLRRPSKDRPFGDVIKSSPTHSSERRLAPHPSLKPQAFLRQIVRAVLPLGEGVVLDPFAGSGSTLAACDTHGYRSVGIELDPQYVEIARKAIPRLAALGLEGSGP